MTDLERCPQCDAVWAPGALWCNLCFYNPAKASASPEPEAPSSLVAEPFAPAPPTEPAAADPPSAEPQQAPAEAASAAAPDGERKRTKEEILADLAWACPVCGEENPFDQQLCSVCGTPFSRLFESEAEKPQLTPQQAARLGLVPGLAMFKLGRGGEGVVRMGIAIASVLCALIFATYGPIIARILLLALYGGFLAFLIAESSVDSRRLAEGRGLQVQGRWLMWVFAALLGVTIFVVIGVSIAADPAGGSSAVT